MPEHSGMPAQHSQFEPVEPLSADLSAFIGRGRRRTGGSRRHGDGDGACRRQLGELAAASLAAQIAYRKRAGSSSGHFRLTSRWKRSTLAATYRRTRSGRGP
eukprot:3502750-Prymnesium_polylepis.1